MYFFQADSPRELRAWLVSGDLHVDHEFKRKADVYNDGAVAIASWDAGSHLNLLNSGYDDVRWECFTGARSTRRQPAPACRGFPGA